MKENNEKELIQLLIKNVGELKDIVNELKNHPPLAPEWVPRSQLMQFLSYGDTQMAALEKNEDLVVARIGNRKFFHRDSIAKLIEKSIV